MPKDKYGEPTQLFDFQQQIIDAWDKLPYRNQYGVRKHGVIFKKPRGFGGSEMGFRWVTHKAMQKDYRGWEVQIITGPGQDLAEDSMGRMRNLFNDFSRDQVDFTSEKRVIWINGCRFKAYPSHKPDKIRGQPKVWCIILDEYDFLPPTQQRDVTDSSEGYIGKCGAIILAISTARRQDGMMRKYEDICADPANKTTYDFLWIPPDVAIGKIFTLEDIEAAKQNPITYKREFLGQYLGEEGNYFIQDQVDICMRLGEQYAEVLENEKYWGADYPTVWGVDPGFGYENFGIVGKKYIGNVGVVVHSEEVEYPIPEEMVTYMKELMNTYPYKYPKVFIDGSQEGWIKSFKKSIPETIHYSGFSRPTFLNLIEAHNGMVACPISFGAYQQLMIDHLSTLMSMGLVAIHPRNRSLIASLNSAVVNKETGKIDKNKTPHDHMFDGLRLSTCNVKLHGQSIFRMGSYGAARKRSGGGGTSI